MRSILPWKSNFFLQAFHTGTAYYANMVINFCLVYTKQLLITRPYSALSADLANRDCNLFSFFTDKTDLSKQEPEATHTSEADTVQWLQHWSHSEQNKMLEKCGPG